MGGLGEFCDDFSAVFGPKNLIPEIVGIFRSGPMGSVPTREQLSALVVLCEKQSFVSNACKDALMAALRKHDPSALAKLTVEQQGAAITAKLATIAENKSRIDQLLDTLKKYGDEDYAIAGVDIVENSERRWESIISEQTSLIARLRTELDALRQAEQQKLAEKWQRDKARADGVGSCSYRSGSDSFDPSQPDDPPHSVHDYADDICRAFNNGGIVAKAAKLIANSDSIAPRHQLCGLLMACLRSSQVNQRQKNLLMVVFEKHEPSMHAAFRLSERSAALKAAEQNAVKMFATADGMTKELSELDPKGFAPRHGQILADRSSKLDSVISEQTAAIASLEAKAETRKREREQQLDEDEMRRKYRSNGLGGGSQSDPNSDDGSRTTGSN